MHVYKYIVQGIKKKRRLRKEDLVPGHARGRDDFLGIMLIDGFPETDTRTRFLFPRVSFEFLVVKFVSTKFTKKRGNLIEIIMLGWGCDDPHFYHFIFHFIFLHSISIIILQGVINIFTFYGTLRTF